MRFRPNESGFCPLTSAFLIGLLILRDCLRRKPVQFHFVVHLLNQPPLVFYFRSQSVNLLLLLRAS